MSNALCCESTPGLQLEAPHIPHNCCSVHPARMPTAQGISRTQLATSLSYCTLIGTSKVHKSSDLK